MTHTHLIQALVEAVAVAERDGATKEQRKAAFEAQAQLEKLVKALAEDASRAAALALENERLRDWLSEIDLRGKHYDAEDMANIAREALDGKPIEGVQP